MKVYRVTLSIIDFDGIGADEICSEIENTRYSNRCINPRVRMIESREIGEWHDEHPLNMRTTAETEFNRLFATPQAAEGEGNVRAE